ncbi:hypothetical protein D3C73_1215560 [compost metagenome]
MEDKSVFSYQVAAGSTISAYSGVVVIRKSSATIRSSLPSTSSRHTISSGFCSSFGLARSPSDAPSKCFMKYSCPLAELEIRLERQINRERGKFSGAPGSSTAKRVFRDLMPSRVWAMISAFDFLPCCAASSANRRLFLLNCGKEGSQPSLAASTL